MILHRKLTDEERARSQLNYNRFSFVNGASYVCLGETIITLFAVQLGASNEFIAVLGSMIYLGYLVMPFGIFRTAKVGAAASQADFWIARNLSALSIALSAFILPFSKSLTLSIVMLGTFLFYGCRAAGCVLSTPLSSDITTEDEAPLLISRNAGFFYISGMIMTAAIATILHFFSGLWVLVFVIVFGASIGIFASTFVRAISETGEVLEAARKNIFKGLLNAIQNNDLRRLAFGWFAMNFTLILITPISLIALKRGCSISNTEALIITAVRYAGAAFFAPFCGRLCNAIGPKLVILLAFLLYPAIAISWLFFPAGGTVSPALSWSLSSLLFLIIGIAGVFCESAASSYFLMACPEKQNQVSGIISLHLLVSVAAGLLGALASSQLIKFAAIKALSIQGFFSGDLGTFRLYFLFTLPFCLLCIFLIGRMRVLLYKFRSRHGHDSVIRILRIVQLRHRHMLIHH